MEFCIKKLGGLRRGGWKSEKPCYFNMVCMSCNFIAQEKEKENKEKKDHKGQL